MSERVFTIVLAILLVGLGLRVGYLKGKHSADRWWQAQVAQKANQATTCYPVEDGRTTNWCTTGAGIGKPQVAVTLGHIEGFPDGCYKVSEDRMRVEVIKCPSSAHPLKLDKRRETILCPATQKLIQGSCVSESIQFCAGDCNYTECNDTKPQGDYLGYIDLGPCIEPKTHRMRYPITSGVPTPQVPQP